MASSEANWGRNLLHHLTTCEAGRLLPRRELLGRGADFTGSLLKGANFRHVDLQRSNFTNADLGKADLRDADLREANFTNSDLSDVDLRGAKLDGAIFLGADLTGVRSDEGFDAAAHSQSLQS